MKSELIYLDNAATSFPKPEAVCAAADDCLRHNAGSYGRGNNDFTLNTESVFFATRQKLAQMFGVSDAHRITFTYNCTDSINIALRGILRYGDHVISSVLEHNSVLRPLFYLKEKLALRVTLLCPDANGRISPDTVRKHLSEKTKAVVLTAMSNIQGIAQPITAIGQMLAERRNTLFVVDGAQAAGHTEISCSRDNVDILCLSPHKGLLSPTGLGILYVSPKAELSPCRLGGSAYAPSYEKMPTDYPELIEAGTPNIPAVWGLNAALDFLASGGDFDIRVRNTTSYLVAQLRGIQGIRLLLPSNAEIFNPPVSFVVTGKDHDDIAALLFNNFRIMLRTGLVCSPLSNQFFGTEKTGVCRLSPGVFNTPDQIETTVEAIKFCIANLA